MKSFQEIIKQNPILPFIREADYAVRDPWFLPKRRLLDYLLIYIQEGSLIVTKEDEKYVLQVGQFCLLQPGDLHTLTGNTKTVTPFVHFDMFFQENREQSFPTRPGQTDLTDLKHLMQPRLNSIKGIQLPLLFNPRQPVRFKECLLRLIFHWQEGDLLNNLQAVHLMQEIILSIIQDMPIFELNRKEKPQSLNWIRSYFYFNLSGSISLEDMASRAHLSPSRFSVLFKEQFHTTPYQYLQLMRIRHAQDLLTNSVYSIQEIGEYCGFANIHHFSNAFKKRTGQSPGSYRKTTLAHKSSLQ